MNRPLSPWRLSWRADPSGRKIADNHYNRQKVGAKQFVPTGGCLVLVIPGAALWVTSFPFAEYVKHAWPDYWVNSTFRNERPDLYLSSHLIEDAIACTRWFREPTLGLVTFIDPNKTRRKRDPGRCYRKAGLHVCRCEVQRARERKGEHGRCPDCQAGTTQAGLVVARLSPAFFPAAQQPLDSNLELFAS